MSGFEIIGIIAVLLWSFMTAMGTHPRKRK